MTSSNARTPFTQSSSQKPSEYEQAGGTRLQRFWLRALVGILGPFVVCAYSIIIWRVYLVPFDSDGPLMFGLRGATWVFYSWFVAGVLGLSLSLYGLAGVEASMLMEPTWNVGDATRLMLHADNTWSGPGGWLKMLKWNLGTRSGGHRRSPSRLWFILALPSMLVFVAWPLSGLTMETTQGYRHASVANPTTMTGFSYDTFNERGSFEAYSASAMTWRSGQDARVPGAGIVYTPEGYDRSRSSFFNIAPAVFPKDDGVTRIFLAPQAEKPTEGRNWGLLLQYNCSIIERAQDFLIISKRDRSVSPYSRLSTGAFEETLENGKYWLVNMNQTDGRWLANLDAVAEFGFETWPDHPIPQELLDKPNFNCYFKIYENITGDYRGIDQEDVFEVAIWQGLQTAITPNNLSLPYNFSIDHNITDYYGSYNVRGFHGLASPLLPMTAVGVQCRTSSSVGSADINGIKSTYSNFERTDTPISTTFDRCGTRFGAPVPYHILRQFARNPEWISSLFRSSAAPPPFYGTYDFVAPDNSKRWSDYYLQLGFLQAEELRRSLLHAYASYAVQLMYNGGQVYTTSNGSKLTFTNPNMTEFLSGTVIKPGVMPAVVPVTLFCIWAIISSTLGIMYGFRRRWTETLDGHTMFRLGAELSDQERRELLKTSNIIKKEDDVALDDIPALVGDTKPEMWLGRIGLVRAGKAKKEKLYE
jgi:hypothetical protein